MMLPRAALAVLAFGALAWAQLGNASAAPKLAFEVASVKPSAPGGRGRVNVSLSEGDRWAPNDGLFSATGQTLLHYIAFAYGLNEVPDPQLNALPDWAKTERYDIEARAGGPATKEEMRAMMRALLADRFKLATHYEVRNVPIYELTLVKPGKLGPDMRPHVDDPPCPDPMAAPAPAAATAGAGAAGGGAGGGRGGARATADGYPVVCGELVQLPGAPAGRWRLGARNVNMDIFMASLRGGMDRPIVDHTGLTGRFDWQMEYVPDPSTDGAQMANFVQDPTGPKLWTALTEQLGLQLKATRGDARLLVFDHIEHLTAN